MKKLKALEILKDIQDSKWCGVKPTLVNWKLEDFNEAIAELEALETKDTQSMIKEEALKDKKYDVYQGDRFTPAVKIASFENQYEAENYRDKAENESIKHDAYTCFFIKENDE